MQGRSSSVLLILFATAAARGEVAYLPYLTFSGDSANHFFGFSVSGAGDVNGDGFDDVIIGASGDDNNGAGSGSARVLSGATGDVLYIFNGDSGNDNFGICVSGAGDVNDDGFDDLIVGASGDDNNGSSSGSARVFSGATGAILHTFNGDSASDQFGSFVSGAGDVNGDGFDDLIVGASGDDNNGADSGSARVFSGATGAILYTFNGDAAGDRFGASVSGAGDVDGDGFDDLIVGASGDDNNSSDSGSARAFSGATGELLHTFNGDSASDQFGSFVSGAGDVNGDGFDDLIVGASGDDNNGADSGSARVFSGATGAILYTFNGDAAGDRFGASVSGAGDVNGDGFDDLIVGASGDDNNGADSGSARVVSGATGAILHNFNGDSANDFFGSVSGAGDVNDDGFDDLIVGAYGDDNRGSSSGSARVYFSSPPPASTKPCPGDLDGDGNPGFPDLNLVISNYNTTCFVPAADRAKVSYLPYIQFNGIAARDLFGHSVSGAGDVNGDGFEDVIVGSIKQSSPPAPPGSAHVLSGATGAILHTFNGDFGGDWFGASVSGAGDVNDDGFDDVIVGAPYDDNNGASSGSARVFCGATGVALYTFNGDSPVDLFGWSVSGAGDVNGDGFDDLIVGAYADDNNGSSSGSARVLSGATGAVLYTFNGDSTSENFGLSVSGAGDVNGDGFDDLIVGATGDDNNVSNSGSARVFSGATGAVLHTFNGDSANDFFGSSVSGAGDVNGDGFDDLIVGATGDDDNGSGSGSARVLSGATGGVLYTFYGDSASDNFGVSVSGAGDVNGDGFDDLIVGATGDDNNGSGSGSARVLCGATGAVLYTFYGDSADDHSGLSVSGAGDVNGDGLDDLVVGARADDYNGAESGSARVFLSWRDHSNPKPCPGDADGDGDADFADLNIVISNFNTSCAP